MNLGFLKIRLIYFTLTTVLSSNTTISIPVQYSYIAGTGIADFAITTTLTQDKEEAGSAITDYTVTGVTASIGGKDYTLTSSDSATSATRTWKLTTPQEVPSGVQAVGLKVFVDSAEVSQASNTSVGNAIILHGLTTEIKGTATITLKGSTIGLSFNPSLPSEQPKEVKTYTITYKSPDGTVLDFGDGKKGTISGSYIVYEDSCLPSTYTRGADNDELIVISGTIMTTNYVHRVHSLTGDDIDLLVTEKSEYILSNDPLFKYIIPLTVAKDLVLVLSYDL